MHRSLYRQLLKFKANRILLLIVALFIILLNLGLHSNYEDENLYPSNFLTNWRRNDNQPIYSRLSLHNPESIMIHHTGKKSSNTKLVNKLRNLYKFSTESKQWGDIPYHFFIDHNGTIAIGRDIHYAPDSNTKFNTSGFINIVLEGDFSHISQEIPSQDQYNSLKKLVRLVKSKYGIEKMLPHNAKAQTLCPGKIELAF